MQYTTDTILRALLLGIGLTIASSAAHIDTFYSYTAFESAVENGCFTTNSIDGRPDRHTRLDNRRLLQRRIFP
jgi:hypothetical protein